MTQCLLIFRSTLLIRYELLLNPFLEDWSYYHTKTWCNNFSYFFFYIVHICKWIGHWAVLQIMPSLLDLSWPPSWIYSHRAVWLRAGSPGWLAVCWDNKCLRVHGHPLSFSSWWPGSNPKEWAEAGKASWDICLSCWRLFVNRSKKDRLGSKSGKSTHVPFLDRKTPNFPLQIWVIIEKRLISTIFKQSTILRYLIFMLLSTFCKIYWSQQARVYSLLWNFKTVHLTYIMQEKWYGLQN